MLRVVAAGSAADTPIQWVYYHVTHKDGRRLSCVFTLSVDDVEQFGGEDLSLIESLKFEPAKEKVSSGKAAERR